MATQTLLTMVQNILSSMSSDEVNSISDTTESMQIAQIIENKYYDIAARGDLTQQETIFQLTPSGNNLQPTLMYVPAGASSIKWLQYYDTNPLDNTQTGQFGSFSHGLNTDIVSSVNWTTLSTTSNTIGLGLHTWTTSSNTLPVVIGQTAIATSGTNTMFGNVTAYAGVFPNITITINVTSTTGSGTFTSWVINNSVTNSIPGYKYVNLVPIDYFMEITDRYDVTESNVLTYTFNDGGYNFTFKYKNDHQPLIACVLSNYFVFFDAFDHTQDVTLQQVKTKVFGSTVPPFSLTDSFVPDIDDQQFPLLLNESKALAFLELKQMPHPKADQEIQRQWTVVQKSKSIANKPGYFDQIPSFGRVPRTGGYGGSPIYRWMKQGL